MILAAVIPALVIGVLSYLLAARQDRGRREGSGAVRLEYGSVLKVLPAIFVFLWALIFLVLFLVEPPKAGDLPVIFGLVAVITAVLVPLALEVRGVTHRISSAGIQRVSPWSSALLISSRRARRTC